MKRFPDSTTTPGTPKRSANLKRRGVSLITVLAMMGLLTALVIHILRLRPGQQAADRTVELQRVNMMKDTAINLVMAQIREATSVEGAAWTSQPGAIRTFHHADAEYNRLYKLYSSRESLIRNIQPYDTRLTGKVQSDDLESTWASRPDEWVDLNAPLKTGSVLRTEGMPQPRIVFPIADPRSTAAGFKLKERMPGISTREEDPALPMPVRWIYMLQDGTMGTMKNGIFTSTDTAAPPPSPANPIVARLAWWADDESCKINVNTASTPAYWSTPMTNSVEDHTFATSQPMYGEYQRQPGHPATVDMGAVLFPWKRWVPQRLRSTVLNGGGIRKWGFYSEAEMRTLWSITPAVRPSVAGQFGSMGGEWDTWKLVKIGLIDLEEPLFASPEELYFKAQKIPEELTEPRENLSTNFDPQYSLLRNLERGGFFFTAKGMSPELNAHGHPRISMVPHHVDILAPIIQATGGASTISLPVKVSPYDMSVGVVTTIGNKAYYYQRSDSAARHGEFGSSGDTQRIRNRQMWEYLKRMTQLPVPGYPEYAGAAKGFLSKYPAPAGAPDSSSDHWQILCAMVDYVRTTNVADDLLASAAQYNVTGHGHASAICTCLSPETFHAPSLGSVTLPDPKDSLALQKPQQAKGYGRTATANEIAFVISKAWQKASPADAVPTGLGNFTVNPTEMTNRTGTLYEVAVVGSAFSPSLGFRTLNPSPALAVQANGTGYNPLIAEAKGPLKFQTASGTWKALNLTLAAGATSEQSLLKPTPSSSVRSQIINWGGQIGPKAFIGGDATSGLNSSQIVNGENVAILSRFFGGGLNRPSISSASGELSSFNMMIFDSPGINSSAAMQCLKLRLPPDTVFTIPDLPQHPQHSVFGKYAANAKVIQTPAFDSAFHTVLSYVIPHGDFRLTHGVMNVEADVLRPHEGNPFGPWPQTDPGVDIRGNPKTGRHSMWEPMEKDFTAQSDMLSFSRYGIVAMQHGDTVSVPYPAGMPMRLPHAKLASLEDSTVYTPAPVALIDRSSGISRDRGLRFGYCRRDTVIFRGSCDPADTGDFDNGIANAPDGPYINFPDSGDNRSSKPYFEQLTQPSRKSAATFDPHRTIPSPVMFGSLPTGVMMRVPWQTLRFRPDPGMNDDQITDPPPGQPFSNYRSGGVLYPRDHHLLDYWWMPVAEPMHISESFAARGKVNMNQELVPFGAYIERMTGLYAVFQGERMPAIGVADSLRYKSPMLNAGPANDANGAQIQVRRFINPDIMAHQFRRRYAGLHADAHRDITAPFNVFRSATEICELWLAPERGTLDGTEPEPSDADAQAYLRWIQGPVDGTQRTTANSFWEKHKLTGDNARERPYAHLYQKLTTKSNVFRVHLRVQSLRKAASSKAVTFDTSSPDHADRVGEEWRGYVTLERTIYPREPALTTEDYLSMPAPGSVDKHCTYRISEMKELTD